MAAHRKPSKPATKAVKSLPKRTDRNEKGVKGGDAALQDGMGVLQVRMQTISSVSKQQHDLSASILSNMKG